MLFAKRLEIIPSRQTLFAGSWGWRSAGVAAKVLCAMWSSGRARERGVERAVTPHEQWRTGGASRSRALMPELFGRTVMRM